MRAFGIRKDRHFWPYLAPSALLQDRDKSYMLEDVCCNRQWGRTGVRFHLEPYCSLPSRKHRDSVESWSQASCCEIQYHAELIWNKPLTLGQKGMTSVRLLREASLLTFHNRWLCGAPDALQFCRSLRKRWPWVLTKGSRGVLLVTVCDGVNNSG